MYGENGAIALSQISIRKKASLHDGAFHRRGSKTALTLPSAGITQWPESYYRPERRFQGYDLSLP